jgi:ABC-type transport system substrate-binding protein
MTATRNPNYWRKGYPYLDSITYKPIIDPSAAVNALQSGEVDMIHTNDPTFLKEFRGNKKWSYYDNSGPVLGQPTVQCIMLNTSKAPFNNHKMRVAMAKCINQQEFVRVNDAGINTPMNGIFLPSSDFYTNTSYPKFDPSGAAELVKQVQRETGQQPSFTLNTISNSQVLRATQYVQQFFQQAGMKVNINVIAQSTLINDALAGTYQATLWRQFGAIDPDLNYVWWTDELVSGPLPLNMARNSDPQLQAALISGRQATNHADRVKAYQTVSKRLGADIPYIWFARDTWAVIANPKVQNFANPTTLQGTKAQAFDEGVLWPTQIWVK